MSDFARRAWAIPDVITGVLIILFVALDCANVVARYVFLSPIIWAEETMGFALVWGVFIGAIHVTRRQDHLRMDLVSSLLAPGPRRILARAEAVLTVAVCGLVAWKSFEALELIAQMGEKSVVTSIPMAIPFAALPAGFGLIALAALLALRSPAKEN